MVYFTPPDSNDSVTRIILENKEYILRFSYNYIGGYWSMGFYRNTETPYITSIKLVPRYPVNHWCRQYIELPQGYFGLVTKLDRIGREDFNNGNAQIAYFTKSEVEAYDAGA
ncbi:MAG: hypothetical protein LUD47_07560 [Clostridia bacterium]|nr:hypothetical protein [Clostridia bacterium]